MKTSLSRRALLRAGTAAIGLFGQTFGLPSRAAARVAHTQRVSILLPRDVAFAKAYLAGLRAGFAQAAPSAEVVINQHTAAETRAGHIHLLAPLGDVSTVAAPALYSLRNGWSQPYLG